MFFKKKKPDIVEMANFSGQYLSTGNIGSYIVYLYRKFGFTHLGFTYRNEQGGLRFIIYGYRSNTKAIRYFKDRCPAMIEKEASVNGSSAHRYKFKIIIRADGVNEVVDVAATTNTEEDE